MAFYDKFPYTNFQELNLDWLTQEVSKVRDNRDATDASAAAALASEQAAKASETAAASSQQAAANSETAAAGSAAASAEYLEQIGTHTAGAVADWLEENIQPTTPAVDASLSVSGAAADAKKTGDAVRKTGDAVNDLKSALSDALQEEMSARITADSALQSHKVNIPLDDNNQPTNGTNGQTLRTKGNGLTEWADVGLPTDEQTADAVSAWLDNHPEATTTVDFNVVTKVFQNVARMTEDLTIESGDTVRTCGYYAVNDDGGALYRISSTAPSTHYETLANGLYAELIYDAEIRPEQFGAYGDGTHDDSTAIQNMIDTVPENSICVFRNTYLCNKGILITRSVNIDMTGECRFPGTLEYGIRIYGHAVKVCKFRLNVQCATDVQTVWTQQLNTIGVDMWCSVQNTLDVSIMGFRTGLRLLAGNTTSEVDCTYNKIFIRRIYNCQYAILLDGLTGSGNLSSGTVAQNTFIAGRIGVQGAAAQWLRAADTDDNSYWAVRSLMKAGRTNNNNTFIACSFEGFGVKESPYENRARVSSDMQNGMFLNCRYEGMTSIIKRERGYVPAMFLGGYGLQSLKINDSSATIIAKQASLKGYSEPVILQRAGTGSELLQIKASNDSITAKFDNNIFYIPSVFLTPDGKPYASGNIDRGMRLMLAYNYNKPTDVINHINPGECKFSNYGHIIYKEYGGVKIHEIQPIYTTIPTSVNPGTMAFVNGRPRWWNGTNWVYADGTVVA